MGYDIGYTIASWQDLIVQGSIIPAYLSWSHYGTVQTAQEAEQVFYAMCVQCLEDLDTVYRVQDTLRALHKVTNYNVYRVYTYGVTYGIEANYDLRLNM